MTNQLNRIETSVFKTTDYSIFKRMVGNRPIVESHVTKLAESMRKHDLMIPIVVNEKMEVVDGQHRLAARKKIKYPVYYVMIKGLTITDTQKANANNKNWAGTDYLNLYCEQNYHAYKLLRKFKEKYQFDLQVCISLLVGYAVRGDQFRGGDLVVGPDTEARAILYAERITSLQPYYKGCRRRGFVYAMMRAFQHTEFDFEEFLNKVSYQSSKLVDCTTVDAYLRIIEEVYNYKRKAEEKIRFK